MKTFLVENHPTLDRIEGRDWPDAEAKLNGVGEVIGELVSDEEKALMACGLTEIKFADEGSDLMTFTGYGAVFNNVDGGGDRILPGAFSETLAEFKAAGKLPSMFYQHGTKGGGPAMPVGVWRAMSEDSYGLRVEGKLSPTSIGRDLYTLLKDGAIGGLSIGYAVKEFGRPAPGGAERRQIKAAHLVEVSLVNDPMNPMARLLSVKAADEITTIRDLESCLRDAGMSRNDAVRVCARFQVKSSQGEPDAGMAAIADSIRRNIKTLSI